MAREEGQGTGRSQGGDAGPSGRDRGGRESTGIRTARGTEARKRREREQSRARGDRVAQAFQMAAGALSGTSPQLLRKAASVAGPAITRAIESLTGATGTAPDVAPPSFSRSGEGRKDETGRRPRVAEAPRPAAGAAPVAPLGVPAPPERNAPEVTQAAVTAREEELKRRGRRSTILTGPSGVSGGGLLGRPQARSAALGG